MDSRATIQSYHESEWRQARFTALRNLSGFSDGRSFQFLVEIIENNQDLAEQELAILCLSQRKNRAASVFLRHYYLGCDSTLKAASAYALGQSQSYDFGRVLLEDLETAIQKWDLHWLKNLILALGELKEFRAVRSLHHLLTEHLTSETDIILAVLLTLGRLERNPEALTRYQSRFFEESTLNQVYQSAVSQVQIRSQFQLEDYLSKIFELKNPHRALPLELKAFQEDEVILGLSLFSMETSWKRQLFASRGLSPNRRLDFLQTLAKAAPSPEAFLDQFTLEMSGFENPGLSKKIEEIFGDALAKVGIRLKFIHAFSEEIDFIKEAEFFLDASVSAELQVQFLNSWNEISVSKSKQNLQKEFGWFAKKEGLKIEALARLARAAAEQELEVKELTELMARQFSNPIGQNSFLLYAERLGLLKALDCIQMLSREEIKNLGTQILAFFESLAEKNKLPTNQKGLLDCIREFQKSFEIEHRVGILRILRFVVIPELETFIIESMEHQNTLVVLNAVIALKGFSLSREASLALSEKLEVNDPVIQGRALDSLCKHTSLIAKRAVIRYLTTHLADDEVVDKVYRCFDPENKGGEEFVLALKQILKQNPDHPQWEKLASLKDRLSRGTSSDEQIEQNNSSPEVLILDARLKAMIPKFDDLDLTIKFALRAAEQPFVQTELGSQQPIDKAPTVLEYCKALDLILEKTLGQKQLFPKLNRGGGLHEFQTLWHRVGFGEDYPQVDRVLELLGLKGKVTPSGFPLHKAKMICATFFNGKIEQERFKIFDGLRAWAVILLIFARKIPHATGSMGPLIKLEGPTEDQIIRMANQLMTLQDLRNPAAHRQTYTDLLLVENIRGDAVRLINMILA